MARALADYCRTSSPTATNIFNLKNRREGLGLLHHQFCLCIRENTNFHTWNLMLMFWKNSCSLMHKHKLEYLCQIKLFYYFKLTKNAMSQNFKNYFEMSTLFERKIFMYIIIIIIIIIFILSLGRQVHDMYMRYLK